MMKFRVVLYPCNYDNLLEPVQWLAVDPDYNVIAQGDTKHEAEESFMTTLRVEFLLGRERGLTDEEIIESFKHYKDSADLELKEVELDLEGWSLIKTD